MLTKEMNFNQLKQGENDKNLGGAFEKDHFKNWQLSHADVSVSKMFARRRIYSTQHPKLKL